MKLRWYRGQLVFFRCLNPAIGEVMRSSDDGGWVEVKWMGAKKSLRYAKNQVHPLNNVLNYWLQKDMGLPFVNADIPRTELVMKIGDE